MTQIKNLIIGNNKYKSVYLKDKIVRRLLSLINDYYLNYLISTINEYHHKPPASTLLIVDAQLTDIINQILTILSSFALGNLDHCTQLITQYNLHDMLFNLIRMSRVYIELDASAHESSGGRGGAEPDLRLIEASLRCLSNLYASAQMAPSLVHVLDAQLYVYDVGTKQAVNLESLLKLYQLGKPAKHLPNSTSAGTRCLYIYYSDRDGWEE